MTERTIQSIALAKIRPNPDQPRKRFDPATLAELAESIRENGLLQPITVTPRGDSYLIVAGERRYHACELLDLETISAIVEVLDDHEVLRLALIENVQREDMNLVETAHGYKALIDDGYSEEEVARLVGKSAGMVHYYLRLTNLAENIQQAVIAGAASPQIAWDLARLDDHNDQRTVFAKIVHSELRPSAVSSFVTAWIAAQDQTTMFGEPEAPGKREARQRRARSLSDKVQACASAWAKLADAIEEDPDAGAMLPAGDVATLQQLAREHKRLHHRLSTEQRNETLVAELVAEAA